MPPATRPRRKKTPKMESESELSLLVENFWSDDESIGLKRNKKAFFISYIKNILTLFLEETFCLATEIPSGVGLYPCFADLRMSESSSCNQ